MWVGQVLAAIKVQYLQYLELEHSRMKSTETLQYCQGSDMGQFHPLYHVCFLLITFMDRQSPYLVAWKWCLPVAANNGDEILITRLGDNVLEDHVMNLAALHPAVAAVFDRLYQVPANEFIEAVFCNFLSSLPMLFSNESFSNPSSYQMLPANTAALGKCAQVQQACLKIRWQIFVTVVNYLRYSFGGEIASQLCT
ncbi:Os11g0607000 [Oryza sativa Japonica Group]|uniref:Os11g0607000 protein n=2 Tax=Oryza sativa subsp. japonica TaxID=39947 RepID=B9FZU1_ORYSJ|nr:expressed protein [Oryza sativa Japonica Group]KAB8115829.1 hypothetical protein EE612_056589 [Oryza sativa]EEE68308.1 hypothetical protein OsJ_26575 [Oryza sativa Japonica Group]BAF28617.1 Os11g0607000 [Oryza sativa Japonica Group]BAG93680.1 unnamed protein product [Oryza sativa Japonica Group]|eukprot:NP_001068254.1 Os11g0607000 [Oryza sativa Japonica Group]